MELCGTLWNFTFGGKVPELFNVSCGTEQLWSKEPYGTKEDACCHCCLPGASNSRAGIIPICTRFQTTRSTRLAGGWLLIFMMYSLYVCQLPLFPPHLSHISSLMLAWCKEGSDPSPVLLKCCVASIVAQYIVLYRKCTGQPAVWGFCLTGLDPL